MANNPFIKSRTRRFIEATVVSLFLFVMLVLLIIGALIMIPISFIVIAIQLLGVKL